MKICTVCKLEKDYASFSRLKTSKDGLQFKCKACMSAYYKEYSKREESKLRARLRAQKYYRTENGRQKKQEYDSSPKRKLRAKAYRQTLSGVAARKREQLRVSRNKLHLVYSAVRRKLQKQPCERCGSTENVQAHHDDYSKPLNVNWLCPKHHSERHKELRNAVMAKSS